MSKNYIKNADGTFSIEQVNKTVTTLNKTDLMRSIDTVNAQIAQFTATRDELAADLKALEELK